MEIKAGCGKDFTGQVLRLLRERMPHINWVGEQRDCKGNGFTIEGVTFEGFRVATQLVNGHELKTRFQVNNIIFPRSLIEYMDVTPETRAIIQVLSH